MATGAKKIAVSIPSSLYERAERSARRRGVTRSRLYADALERLLQDEEDDDITARINEVCRDLDTSMDPTLKEGQRRALSDTWEW